MAITIKTPIKLMGGNAFLGPAAIIFISANIANAANLLFNMIFARLMGPALFADLTLLLTLKLGVLSFLGAVQFAVSELTAKRGHKAASKAEAKALSWLSLKFAIPVMFIIIASANFIVAFLNFSSPGSLRFLALAIPFFLPMVIYRGLTQGLIDVPKIVISVQAEWIIRLFGSLILWKLGSGLPGIAIAVVLSIIAGFLFSTERQDWLLKRPVIKTKASIDTAKLGALALPYFILQMAQVLVLDSDIVVAKAIFSAETAGLAAGLLLIQRIFFFAFLSCSTILQPYIAKQKKGAQNHKELLLLLTGIALITMVALILIIPNANLMAKIMLGDDYVDLAPIIWISALTGAVFIMSYLCAIHQIVKGQNFAAKLIIGFGMAQLTILTGVNYILPDMSLYLYFSLKLAVQVICAVSLLTIVMKPAKERQLKA